MLDGKLLNERYKVIRPIGGGGMANVYLAEDTILNRKVAVKVLRLEYANDEEFIARFHREAHSATSLSHPNVVSIYDVGEEEGIYYMVMEYIDGMTLKKYVQINGPLPVEEALDIMKQVTSAIAHAHENGIIHRDIKPQNILIDSYRQVKVTDFGIAVALSATSLTQTNSVLGSVHYLSPEQARGGMANGKSDIYSLGIVMYEILTGKLPFSGESAVSIAIKHLQNETPSIREYNQDIPQSVENVVLKSTAKDPFYRYGSVYEMEDQLETALEPTRKNEQKFTVPAAHGDTTRAMPILKEENFQTKATEETIVHNTGSHSVPGMQPVNKKQNKQNQVKNEKVRKKKRPMLWIFFTTLFILALGTSTAIAIPYLLQPKDVEVIDVTGMEYEQALLALNESGLDVNRETMFSDDVEEGYVINSDPKAGSVIKEGQTVTVFSSQGKERSKFSNYVGEEYSQTKQLLEDRGYKEVIAYEKYSDRPVGEIITQIQPQPESQVIPEETNVIFEISSGPELITLPSLISMSEEEARAYLNGQGLQAAISRESSDKVEEGHVINQSPEAFVQLEENATVELVISNGPPVLPPVTHSVTFTVPFTGEEEGQTVEIYVGDKTRDLSEVFKEETITEDTEYTIRLVIPPDSSGTYRVVKEEEVMIEREISYDESGEDE